MMISKEQLERLYGEEGEAHFKYLSNKHKGGVNNSKGNIFENQFAVYKIAANFNEGAAGQTTLFSSQVLCFIDDLIIEKQDENTVEHYQLKDVAGLSWHDNPHSIKDDFIMQHNVCSDNGMDATLQLVVSREEVKQDLISKMPDELRGVATVLHFQNASSINNLIRENTEVRDVLRNMCALSNPSSDKLDTLGSIILGVWSSVDQKQTPLAEILEKCVRQNPHYIRGLQDNISQRLTNIFSNIDGFIYAIERGYISWTYRDTDNGTLSYRIGSSEFEQWENDVFNVEPFNSFEDIEPFLI